MDWQSLGYAAIQIAHNFGAVTVVGGPLFALGSAPAGPHERALAWLVLAGWTVQVVSGAAFGAASYVWYGQFPDLHGIARLALVIKIACATAGSALIAVHLVAITRKAPIRPRLTWGSLLALGATALTAAAFLRWFS